MNGFQLISILFSRSHTIGVCSRARATLSIRIFYKVMVGHCSASFLAVCSTLALSCVQKEQTLPHHCSCQERSWIQWFSVPPLMASGMAGMPFTTVSKARPMVRIEEYAHKLRPQSGVAHFLTIKLRNQSAVKS